MRGATTAGESVYQLSQFQSTLLMRGATRQIFVSPVFGQIISIHAPHARSDLTARPLADHLVIISIHAPHARSDLMLLRVWLTSGNFNPRSSCEERRRALINKIN